MTDGPTLYSYMEEATLKKTAYNTATALLALFVVATCHRVPFFKGYKFCDWI